MCVGDVVEFSVQAVALFFWRCTETCAWALRRDPEHVSCVCCITRAPPHRFLCFGLANANALYCLLLNRTYLRVLLKRHHGSVRLRGVAAKHSVRAVTRVTPRSR